MRSETFAFVASMGLVLVLGVVGLFLVVVARPPLLLSLAMTVGPLALLWVCLRHYREARELEQDDTP